MERSLKEERIKKKYEKDRATFEKSQRISQINRDLVIRYVEDATIDRENKTKYPYSYNSMRFTIMKKICEDCFESKNLNELTRTDILKFEEDLQQDRILNTSCKNPKPYSDSYKAKFGKILIEFFSLYYGDNKDTFAKLMLTVKGNKILTTSYEKYKKKSYLTYENVRKIIQKTDKLLVAVYFAVMFDGGPRIEAFLNTKFSDIIEKEGEEQNYFIFTFPTFSKHKKGATIPLFMFYNTIKEYIELEKTKSDYNPNNYFFPKSAQWCNKMFKNEVKKHLGEYVNGFHYKSFHNHSGRHSSATHYALYVAKRESAIYNRYGWAFGSSEAKEYIQLISARDEEEEKLFRKSSVAEETRSYRNKLKELTEKLDKLNEENDKLKEENEVEATESMKLIKDYQRTLEEHKKTTDIMSKLIKHLPNTPEKQELVDEYYGDDKIKSKKPINYSALEY